MKLISHPEIQEGIETNEMYITLSKKFTDSCCMNVSFLRISVI